MARSCSICDHPKRLIIDKALIGGRALAAISREFNISTDALRSHRNKHLSKRLITLTQQREMAGNLDIQHEMESLITRVKAIVDYAEEHKQHQVFLKAAAELRGSFELLLKIAVALNDASRQDGEQAEILNEEKERQEFAKKLQILSVDELILLEQLQQKIDTQDRKIRIVPQTQPQFPEYKPNSAKVPDDNVPSNVSRYPDNENSVELSYKTEPDPEPKRKSRFIRTNENSPFPGAMKHCTWHEVGKNDF